MHGITRESIEQDIQSKGLPLLRETEEIYYFEPTYYFIENPATSAMKNFLDLPCYTVDYCMSMYGFSWRTVKLGFSFFFYGRVKREKTRLRQNKD